MEELVVTFDEMGKKYMDEITKIIQGHKESTVENALEVNKEIQKRLRFVRDKLVALQDFISKRYRSNAQTIVDGMGFKKRGISGTGAYIRGRTFFYEGNMYFRDKNLRNCPNNEDYERRKITENEIFPKQWDLKARHFWTIKDKTKLVHAVKGQVLEHLNTQHESSIKISNKLAILLDIVRDISFDWFQISAYNLQYRHSPETCEAIWNMYLRPKLNRSDWTTEEKKLLFKMAKNNNFQNWSAISVAMGSKRSDYQCFIQYHTVVCYMRPNRTRKWLEAHDQRLLDVIRSNTFNNIVNWGVVCAHFPDRNKQSVMHRYNHTLNVQYDRGHFTPEEDILLMAAVEEFKGEFRNFPRSLFPKRSLVQLRNHYHQCLLTREKLEPWTLADDDQLLKFVSLNGETSWTKCAEILTKHTSSGCRNRYNVIKKHFEKNPNLKLEDIPRRKRDIGYTSTITAENWVEKVVELRENPNAVFKISNNKQRKIKEIKVKKENLTRKHKPIKPKTMYYEKLRTQELRIYKCFKYSYNFRFQGIEFKNWGSYQKATAKVMQALNFLPSKTMHLNTDDRMGRDRRYKTRKLIHIASRQPEIIQIGYKLQPGWSTAMAFRAFCILNAQPAARENVTENLENHMLIQLFRQRLRSILYQTTLLSRLDPTKIIFKDGLLQCIQVETTKRKADDTENPLPKRKHFDDTQTKHENMHTKLEIHGLQEVMEKSDNNTQNSNEKVIAGNSCRILIKTELEI